LWVCLVAAPAAGQSFEVWLVDQSNTTGLTYGGKIHIFEGAHLMGASLSSASPIATIDLSGATAAMCVGSTGANPVRPHMLFFNSTRSHAVLAFVASGHVVIFNAVTRTPVACLRTSAGAGGARQAHAAVPTPDDRFIVVANQNGKLLERINTNYATNTFLLDGGATINLVTCTTPNGVACELAGVRPDNAPICPIIDSSSSFAFITLRGGGLFVVNPAATPMRIMGEYDRTTVHGNGCGGSEAGGAMFIDSGGGTAANLHEFDVYRFPLTGYSAANPPNTPAPDLIYSDDVEGRDAHGTVAVGRGRYLWVADRQLNVIETFDAVSGTREDTLHVAGLDNRDPSPDLMDISPSGNRVFVSLRGPNPLSGDPHVSTGAAPGMMVIQVTAGGRGGVVKGIVGISNPDGGGVERGDPHGIRVRVR
jgi:hypothetical protein